MNPYESPSHQDAPQKPLRRYDLGYWAGFAIGATCGLLAVFTGTGLARVLWYILHQFRI